MADMGAADFTEVFTADRHSTVRRPFMERRGFTAEGDLGQVARQPIVSPTPVRLMAMLTGVQ